MLACAAAIPASAGALEDIKARGELIAGVKADYPPFANRDNSGEIVGLEVDLAKDLADRLGVKLKLFAVSADGRVQFLQQGSVDLLIATMAVTGPRQRQMGIIEPYYYASRLAVLAPKTAGIASLADLKGKTACTILNAYYHEELSARADGVKLLPLRKLDDAGKALRDGRCAAFIEENTHLFELKSTVGQPLADYRISQLDFAPLPWAIAVRAKEKDTPFGKLVADTVADWHRSGKLIALEKKWLGENTSWLIDQQKAVK
jgi:polar amino acid transport system substrate-binding protein